MSAKRKSADRKRTSGRPPVVLDILMSAKAWAKLGIVARYFNRSLESGAVPSESPQSGSAAGGQ